jgi:hypothetical protein
MEKTEKITLNPWIPGAILLVLLLSVLYFGWLRPQMVADQTLRDFNTPEAQAKRDPDQRQLPPEFKRKVEALKAKETHLRSTATVRSRE